MNEIKNNSEPRDRALKMLEQELGGSIADNDYEFGEWVEAKDRAFQTVGIFIEASANDVPLKEFWEKVEKELLYNL